VAEDWSRPEAEAIVADYFGMLADELRGTPYRKSEHRNRLIPLLRGRSAGSVERKHQNISAILIESGFPYISGYKPLRNYQELLRDVVEERLGADHVLPPLAEQEATRPIDETPAAQNILALRSALAPYGPRPRVGIDYLAMEARNTDLGAAGEHLVIEFEVARLRHLKKPKLAERVELVSKTRGDGLGFDVLSFDPSGRERFIEVKTTAFGKDTPFYLTRSELRFSVESAEQFHLYRLFQFRNNPKFFALTGRLDQKCLLDPTQYIARVA
jgi:hypothetical protein